MDRKPNNGESNQKRGVDDGSKARAQELTGQTETFYAIG
jgi:hypothetical protein